MKRTALITGVFGQDGSYLAEILHENGYDVHGIEKMPLTQHAEAIRKHLASKGISPIMHQCDLDKYEDVASLMDRIRPDECYHLAAIHYSSSATAEERSRIARELYENNIMSAANIVHAINDRSRASRLVLAGSCLMYDSCKTTPQDEQTPYATSSVYGLSKVAASELAGFYRKAEGLHISTAILYNHESPRRSSSFVTQKIAQSVVDIKERKFDSLTLGNLDSIKDWGYAKDYAYGMWLMALQNAPGDYVLASGRTHSVKEFVELAFDAVGISDWIRYVKIDNKVAVKTGVSLVGNPKRAYDNIAWRHTISFEELVVLMVRSAASKYLD